MRNKGFTLVELLAVIVILSLIMILVTPLVNKFITNSENSTYDFQIKTIEDSAINFTIEYGNYIDLDDFTIDLKLLKDLAFVDFDIKNPKTNKYFSDDTLIKLTKNKGNYKAQVIDYDSDTISDSVKYNHIVLIENKEVNIDNVVVLNLNGIKVSNYSVTTTLGDTIIDGYTTNIYTVTVDSDTYEIIYLEN